MKLKDIIELPYCERGSRITQGGDLYRNRGDIRVISSTTTGPMGYYDKYNYILKKNSFVYSIEGCNSGYVSIYEPQKIWLMDVAGVINIKEEYLNIYSKESIALFLQFYFVKHRHNNGTQPKFNLKRCLEIEIDLTLIEKTFSIDISAIEEDSMLYEKIISNYSLIEKREKIMIPIRDFITNYKERGTRLVVGRDLYQCRGKIKVISSTTTGPMGYYDKCNYDIKNNDFVYAIDGANAGYVSKYDPQKIWLTDHAGIVTVKDEYCKAYGSMTIALFLQNIFVNNLGNTGTQPMFILKSILDLNIDIGYLKALEEVLSPDTHKIVC
jgi:hypothetical protein